MIIAPTFVILDAGLNMFYFYFSVVGSFLLLLLVFNIPKSTTWKCGEI
jgi:hypothetical protein